MQSTKGAQQVFMYLRLSLKRFSRFNCDRIFRMRSELILIDVLPTAPSFILSERRRTAYHHRGKCLYEYDIFHQFPVSDQSLGIHTGLLLRL